jgi:hypothetical protein
VMKDGPHVDSTRVWDAEWIVGAFRKACVPSAPRTAGASLWRQSAWFGVSGVATLVFLLAPGFKICRNSDRNSFLVMSRQLIVDLLLRGWNRGVPKTLSPTS